MKKRKFLGNGLILTGATMAIASVAYLMKLKNSEETEIDEEIEVNETIEELENQFEEAVESIEDEIEEIIDEITE